MDLSQRIEHTLLNPLTLPENVRQYCEEALEHQFAGVCAPPFYVKDVFKILGESPVKIVTVAGFPFGYSNVPSKIEEMKKAFEEGADEVDAMINLCAIKAGQWNYVKSEIESLVTICHMKGKLLKLIIEIGQLSEEEIKRLCEFSAEAEVDFMKTSTGVIGAGASEHTVSMLRNLLPPAVKIKASGDIRDRHFAELLIHAGADRIGTSVGTHLVAN